MLPITDETVDETTEETESLLPSKTWRIDFERHRITDTTDEKDALLQSVLCALNTERYEKIIYSWDYGVELDALIGTDADYAMSEIERMTTEALEDDDRILEIDDFRFAQNNGGTTTVNFRIDSVFGTIEIEKEVTQ